MINGDRELAGVAAHLLSAERVYLDTEFVRRTTYYPILALLQMAADDQLWLIDTTTIKDWRPLMDALDSSLLVMHSASEDLDVFRSNLQWLPRRLFDTQVAAAFLGIGSALSYAALVETLLGVSLEKSQTQSDWLVRPLSEAQLHYAREDVLYLQQLHDQLGEQLAGQQKMAWMEAYMDQTLASAAQVMTPEQAYLRVKGAAHLNPLQLALLVDLAAWRERRARELDKPRNWLVRDAEMVKIARMGPKSRADLDRSVGMAPESIRRYADEILDLVATPREPKTDIEPLPGALDGAERELVRQLQTAVENLAQERQIAARLIANRAELEQLVRFRVKQGPPPALISDWRSEPFAKPLLETIDGNG